MMPATDNARPPDAPLIEPLPIDGLLGAFSEWAAADRRYAQQVAQIDSEVAALRRRLKAANLTPAEMPGAAPVKDPALAARMVKAAGDRLVASGEARDEARREVAGLRAAAAAALAEAQEEAEAALTQAHDVVLARRVVAVVTVLLVALLGKVLILG